METRVEGETTTVRIRSEETISLREYVLMLGKSKEMLSLLADVIAELSVEGDASGAVLSDEDGRLVLELQTYAAACKVNAAILGESGNLDARMVVNGFFYSLADKTSELIRKAKRRLDALPQKQPASDEVERSC